MVGVPPDVVPDSGQTRADTSTWSRGGSVSGEVLSISDVRLEPRHRSTNSLGTPSLSRHNARTPTPTWTEGTPSYTESTYSGDQGW